MNPKIKLLGLAIVAALALSGIASASASAAFSIKSLDVTYENKDGSDATQAGSHPFAVTTDVEFSNKVVAGKTVPDGSPKDLTVALPPGLIGDRSAVPYCENADFLLVDTDHQFSNCPNESVVGILQVRIPGETSGGDASPAFNLAPPPGAAAKIGFVLLHVPVALLVRVNPAYPHNLIATSQNISNIEPIGGTTVTIWGYPADPVHDAERGTCLTTKGSCKGSSTQRPFLTLPRSCEGPQFAAYAATSWEEPQSTLTGTSTSALQTTGCENLGFDAQISAKPSTANADGASGLAFNLDIDDPKLT